MFFLENLEKIIPENLHTIDKSKIRKTITALLDYALKNGIEIYRVFPSKLIFILKKDGKLVWLHKSLSSKANPIGVNTARNKHLTKKLLKTLGYPVAPGMVISSADELEEVMEKIAFPLVIKPLNSSEGKGITPYVDNKALLMESFLLAKNISDKVLVEKYIPGDYYRLTYVADGSFAAVRNVPAYITGDGMLTAEELIRRENNSNKDRGENRRLKKIRITDKTRRFLISYGYKLDSVIEQGRKVPLCFGGFDGGEYIDATDSVHPSILDMANEISKIMNLPVIGIDIITADISRPLDETGGVIIEINGTFPDLQIHARPTQGEIRDLAPNLINYLFR